MNRTTLLASAAVFLLAMPAFADGGGRNLIGSIDLGYDWRNADAAPSDVDIDDFHGRAAALWRLDGNWNVQGEFGFNSNQAQGVDVDTWDIRGSVFWRDQSQGLIGGELSYQSLNTGFLFGTADGIGIAAHGEYYWTPDITVAARVRYSSLDPSAGSSADIWSLGAVGHYYLQPNLGLSLGYNWQDLDSSINPWLLRAEAEYLLSDCDTSLYAGLEFGDSDALAGNYWGLGVGLRLHFGTSGSLAQRDRTGTVRDLNTDRFPF